MNYKNHFRFVDKHDRLAIVTTAKINAMTLNLIAYWFKACICLFIDKTNPTFDMFYHAHYALLIFPLFWNNNIRSTT